MRLSALESKIFGKVCYGYQRDKRGIVEAVEEYRLMSNLYAEEVSQTIAYSMFKGSKVGADGNFLHPNAIRYMLIKILCVRPKSNCR